MRAVAIVAAVCAGAALAYLIARQVAPNKTGQLEATVTDAFDNIIARFEGFRSDAYRDEEGNWTIGFGHLIVPGDGFYHPVNNPGGVYTVTVEAARSLYEDDTAKARLAVEQAVNVPLSESQRAALVSLAYNIGSTAFRKSTLVRKLNDWDYVGAADEFLRWNKVQGESGDLVASAGLTTRREKEKALFLT